MSIVVFGANGRTGQLLVRQALDRGMAVTAVTRRPGDFPIDDGNLTVERADVFDPAAVERAVAGHDAVISALGVPYSRREITVYSRGMANILAAMRATGVRRVVSISATAVDPRYDNQGGYVFERVLKPLISRTMGRTTYADQRLMEGLLRDSDLDWTVIRPSGLFETDAVTDYVVTEGFITGKFTSRSDLADAMLRELGEQAHVRAAVAVATVSVRPNLVRMIMREAFHRADPPPPTAGEQRAA
jgi:putative NADH-flavin reductase